MVVVVGVSAADTVSVRGTVTALTAPVLLVVAAVPELFKPRSELRLNSPFRLPVFPVFVVVPLFVELETGAEAVCVAGLNAPEEVPSELTVTGTAEPLAVAAAVGVLFVPGVPLFTDIWMYTCSPFGTVRFN